MLGWAQLASKLQGLSDLGTGDVGHQALGWWEVARAFEMNRVGEMVQFPFITSEKNKT